MATLNKNSIIYERMRRQRLLEPIGDGVALGANERRIESSVGVDDRVDAEKLVNDVDRTDVADRTEYDEYIELFRLLQPVAPPHFTRPGDPPRLRHRTQFDDTQFAQQLRAEHRIVKGRFADGRVAYVLREDLERYATVFRKMPKELKPIHEDIMDLVTSSSGMSKDQLKAELPYPAGQISKALVTLQEAFLLYEDQIDTDWDTGWFAFAEEWFELRDDAEHFMDHAGQVVLNFLEAMVFVTFQQIKDWSQMNIRTLRQVLEQLQSDDKIKMIDVDGLGEGYIRTADLNGLDAAEDVHHVFMLDKSDILYRSHMTELKKRYEGQGVLHYLLIDGEFQGVVLGHWRIGPYDIEDIQVDLEREEAEARKEDIIKAIYTKYSPDRTAILRYNGEKL